MNHVTCNMYQKGFTLIEAVVATSVFAFVVTSVLGVYLSTLQVDAKTRAQRAVAQNARFIMEFVGKEVRNGDIDYAAYGGGQANSTNEIFIRNQLDEAERIYLSGTNLALAKPIGTTVLNSSGVRVTDAKFYVSPSQNPLTPAKLANQQPSVTVVLELTSNFGNGAGDVVVLNIQSTFTVRSYPQRL
jgi:type II secretory pathway pseudopilin PulG